MRKIYQKKFSQTSAFELNHADFPKIRIPYFFIALIMLVILFYLWQKVTLDSLGYEIGNLQKQEKTVIEYNEKLKLKRDMLRSMDRIEKISRDQLGMQLPDKVKIIPITIDENKK